MTQTLFELVITPQGVGHGLYDETLDLSRLGEVQVRRASHVEADAAGAWWADLSPVHGPTLGPFARRSVALAAEVSWLRRYLLDGPLLDRHVLDLERNTEPKERP